MFHLEINWLEADWREAIGALASLLVFATFFMEDMFQLRIIAIISNVAFFSYGMLRDLYPIVILHATLFPLNVVRLTQLVKNRNKQKQ